jgi:phosphoglycolate phosphatase
MTKRIAALFDIDVAAAHAAGIPCVGVASHHYNAEELKDGGADWVIDSLTDGLPL